MMQEEALISEEKLYQRVLERETRFFLRMLESRSCESQDSLSEKLQDADDVEDECEKRAY